MEASKRKKRKRSANEKLDQYRQLAKLLDTPDVLGAQLQQYACEGTELLKELCRTPTSVGHFYKMDIIELSQLATMLGVIAHWQTEESDPPDEVKELIKLVKEENVDWLDLDDHQNVRANMFAAGYVLNKSMKCINTLGRSLDQLLNDGSRNWDRGQLKLAVKIDPATISTPQVSSMILYYDFLGKTDFRRDLQNALRKPYDIKHVEYPKLRYMVWALHKGGLLKDMSEEDQYEFLCVELKLYPETGEDPFGSLSKLIRRWQSGFRT